MRYEKGGRPRDPTQAWKKKQQQLGICTAREISFSCWVIQFCGNQNLECFFVFFYVECQVNLVLLLYGGADAMGLKQMKKSEDQCW